MDQQDQADLNRLCYDVLAVDRRGVAIMDYLIRRYVRSAVTKGGIDGVLETFADACTRRIVDDLSQRIHQHQQSLLGGGEPEPPAD